MLALILGIYGAVLSTFLAVLTVTKFLADRRTINVAQRLSYLGQDEAHYTFVVTNVSTRPVTIIDCMSMNMANTPNDGLQPDWGVQPNRIERLFEDDEVELFRPPYVLAPGGALLLNLDSSTLVEQYADYARSVVSKELKSWTPTDQVILEIYHSLAAAPVTIKFDLRCDEVRRALEQASA